MGSTLEQPSQSLVGGVVCEIEKTQSWNQDSVDWLVLPEHLTTPQQVRNLTRNEVIFQRHTSVDGKSSVIKNSG